MVLSIINIIAPIFLTFMHLKKKMKQNVEWLNIIWPFFCNLLTITSKILLGYNYYVLSWTATFLLGLWITKHYTRKETICMCMCIYRKYTVPPLILWYQIKRKRVSIIVNSRLDHFLEEFVSTAFLSQLLFKNFSFISEELISNNNNLIIYISYGSSA